MAEKDVKDASAGVLRDLKRFQADKEEDLKRYMVCCHSIDSFVVFFSPRPPPLSATCSFLDPTIDINSLSLTLHNIRILQQDITYTYPYSPLSAIILIIIIIIIDYSPKRQSLHDPSRSHSPNATSTGRGAISPPGRTRRPRLIGLLCNSRY